MELRAITNSDLKRDSAAMMSSTIPSAKYSCSGSPLMFANGKTAMEGRSGNASDTPASAVVSAAVSSRTTPTKRMPRPRKVRIRRCAFPLSPIAVRAALMRVVIADSETMRPFQTAARRSSLLTTRSRCRTR